MKVKHCFFFVLFLLAIGSFFVARSFSPSVKVLIQSATKGASYSLPKDAGQAIQRPSKAEPSSNFVAPIGANGAASSPSFAPSKLPVPAVGASSDAASAGDANAGLATQLTRCMTEMQDLQSALSARHDSTDDVRAQLQEALLKLRAAEEELQRLQVQKPVVKDDAEINRCRIIERESSLCKSELRSSHAKVRRALCPRARCRHSHSPCAVCRPAKHRIIVSGPGLVCQLFRRQTAFKRKARCNNSLVRSRGSRLPLPLPFHPFPRGSCQNERKTGRGVAFGRLTRRSRTFALGRRSRCAYNQTPRRQSACVNVVEAGARAPPASGR